MSVRAAAKLRAWSPVLIRPWGPQHTALRSQSRRGTHRPKLPLTSDSVRIRERERLNRPEPSIRARRCVSSPPPDLRRSPLHRVRSIRAERPPASMGALNAMDGDAKDSATHLTARSTPAGTSVTYTRDACSGAS